MKKYAFLAAFLLSPTSAMAHAGDHAAQLLTHYLESPFHLWPVAVIISLTGLWFLKRHQSK